MRFPPQAQKKHGNSVFKQKILALFSRGSHHKPRKREIPFSNKRYWHYFPEVPITSQNKQRKSRFQIEDIGIIFQRFPSQAQKKHGNPVFKQKILALFSRGSHHKPKKREIPFSNEVPITSPEKTRKFRFQIEDIGIIFQRFPSQAQKKENPVFKQKILALFSRKAQKDTEIPFSNEVPITSPEKTRKFRFQIEDIGIIFQRFPSQAQKREIPFSNRRYWHYFPEVPITSPKKGKSRFQMRFPSQAQKKHGNSVFKQKILILFSRGCHHKPKRHKPKKREIPFSNRRQWHYFPEKPKKTRKSRFQMRFPSQAQKKHGNSVFKQKILALFSRGFHHKPKKREIPFSNRRYWHYFPEKPKKTRKSRFQMRFPPQAQKKTRKFRFQIEDIGIIFQRLPSQAQKKGNPVFKQKILALFSQILKTRLADKPFQIEDIVKQPMGKRKRPFQIEDIHYMHMYLPYLLQILKTRLADKPFSNRRYCQTTNGEAEKTISNRRYSLYQPQIFRTRLCDKPFFKQKIFGWMIHQVCAFGVGLNGF